LPSAATTLPSASRPELMLEDSCQKKDSQHKHHQQQQG
jgi:hypothetical protein